MDISTISDEACERLFSGRLTEADGILADIGWFLEDVRSVYCEPIPAAARAMHPAAVAAPNLPPGLWPPEGRRTCRPLRSWWYPPAADHLSSEDAPADSWI